MLVFWMIDELGRICKEKSFYLAEVILGRLPAEEGTRISSPRRPGVHTEIRTEHLPITS
jgi:hypothetical protein